MIPALPADFMGERLYDEAMRQADAIAAVEGTTASLDELLRDALAAGFSIGFAGTMVAIKNLGWTLVPPKGQS